MADTSTVPERKGMFSAVVPGLQLAWDATSLRAFMACPRQYQYSILEGWTKGGVHIEFGSFFASGTETYRKARLDGLDKLGATVLALRTVIERSWDQKPWGGSYASQWRCTGTVPFKNSKGNKAKCPWSHKGHWFPEPAPLACGSCGSEVEVERRWVPGDKTKHRVSLVRLLADWCDEQPEEPGGVGLFPIRFPDGRPAVELNLRMELLFPPTPPGERFTLVVNLDSVSAHGGDEHYITDNKTTKNAIDDKYWSQYDPNVQVAVYDLVGSTLLAALNIRGVAIEGAQVLQGGNRFGLGIFDKTDAHREELLGDIGDTLIRAVGYVYDQYWPMNRSACFLCQFKKVCAAGPDRRQAILEDNFTKRHWNPLAER